MRRSGVRSPSAPPTAQAPAPTGLPCSVAALLQSMRRRKRPMPAELGLTAEEGRVLGAMRSPWHVQQFVVGLQANFERDGDTLRSVRGVLRHREAHCIEAAFVAACALWL